MNKEETRKRVKLYFLMICFLGCIAALMVKAFHLQVVEREFLLKKAKVQIHKPIRLIPLRGEILDRNGSPLAISVKTTSVYSQRLGIKDKSKHSSEDLSKVVRMIEPYTSKKPKELSQILLKRASFTWLARQIPMCVGRDIQNLGYPGIGIETEGKRYYPKKELAGQVVGFVGVDSQGLEGLELYYERSIKGKEVTLSLQRDALGQTLWKEIPAAHENEIGKELILTLDSRIQFFAERALADAAQKCGAVSGSVLVMDPMTGEILAMAIQPSFNPNRFQLTPPFARRNHTVTDSFEPGSTAKAFTLAAALEEGVVEEGKTFYCENGRYAFAGRTIHDLHRYGELTVRDIIIHSSNIGATKIAEILGAKRLHRYLKGFGFGSPTGIDLPGEVGGTLRNYQKWPNIALANHAFGQGFTVTAIQMATAFSALANGGFLVQPYIVKEIRDPFGKESHTRAPEVVRRVISRATSQRVLSVLEGVVQEGTGKNARIPGYRVGGKTGTAQKVDPELGIYSSSKYVASFIGVVPVEKPELVMVVILDEPAVRGTGGSLAAPVFREVAWNALRYRNITPEGSPELLDSDPEVIVAAQGQGRTENEVKQVQKGELSFPDLYGLSLRKALQVIEGYPVTVEIQGSGKVISQIPLPGAVIQGGDHCVLEASPSTDHIRDVVPIT